MIVKIIIFVVYGLFLGIVTVPLSKRLTLSRTDDPGQAAPLNRTPLKIAAVILGLVCAAGVVFTADDYYIMVKYLLLLVPIFSIGFVDALVRKIPNPLLLSMLVVDIAFLIYECVKAKDGDEILSLIMRTVVGFIVGFAVCLLPGLLKIPMGAGDVKYSAVIGATLYFMGYFQAMVLMALLVALFYVGLKITKKGDIKTLMPMGPFLSFGTVITMCFPIADLFGNTVSLF